MTTLVSILVFRRLRTSPIYLFRARILNHIDLTVRIRLIRASLVVLLHLRNLVLNVIEREHVAPGLVLGRGWMSETLTCLRLWLDIHNLLLIHQLIVVRIRHIKI